MFEIGKTYKTIDGNTIVVLDRTEMVGYECLVCSDGSYRYDRSTNSADAGRVTGTNHDYTYPKNIYRADKIKEVESTDVEVTLSKNQLQVINTVLGLVGSEQLRGIWKKLENGILSNDYTTHIYSQGVVDARHATYCMGNDKFNREVYGLYAKFDVKLLDSK